MYGLNCLFNCLLIIELLEKWPMSKKDMSMNSALLQLTKQGLVNPVIHLSLLLLNLAFVSKIHLHKFIPIYYSLGILKVWQQNSYLKETKYLIICILFKITK